MNAKPSRLTTHPIGGRGDKMRLVELGPVPPHITLDTDAGTAEWCGVFENGTLEL